MEWPNSNNDIGIFMFRNIVIKGANRGIGLALTQQYAANGDFEKREVDVAN